MAKNFIIIIVTVFILSCSNKYASTIKNKHPNLNKEAIVIHDNNVFVKNRDNIKLSILNIDDFYKQKLNYIINKSTMNGFSSSLRDDNNLMLLLTMLPIFALASNFNGRNFTRDSYIVLNDKKEKKQCNTLMMYQGPLRQTCINNECYTVLYYTEFYRRR